jgi:hypothetical protein
MRRQGLDKPSKAFLLVLTIAIRAFDFCDLRSGVILLRRQHEVVISQEANVLSENEHSLHCARLP